MRSVAVLFASLLLLLGCPDDAGDDDAGDDDSGDDDSGDDDSGDDDSGDDDSGDDDTGIEADRFFEIGAATGDPIPALHGHYDLSGGLFALDQVPGLIDAMGAVGFPSWRVGVGRWEIGTYALPEGGCEKNPLWLLPIDWTLDDVLAERDWFKLTVDLNGNGVADLEDTELPENYDWSYFDSVLAVADAFGAVPYISIDHMPRDLSSGTELAVDDCAFSFANGISNAPPADAEVFGSAVLHFVRHYLDGWGGGVARSDLTYWEYGNEPDIPDYFWNGTFEQWAVTYAMVALYLDAWRAQASEAGWQAMRVGGGSFATTTWFEPFLTAVAKYDLPLDFFSAHFYNDDPTMHVEMLSAVRTLADDLALIDPAQFGDLELVYAEWGVDLVHVGDAAVYDSNWAAALHAATLVSAVEEQIAITHRAVFHDMYGIVPIGIVRGDGSVTPSWWAYAAFDAFAETPERVALDPYVHDGPTLIYAALAGTGGGSTQVLLVHLGGALETVAVTWAGDMDWETQILAGEEPLDGPTGTGTAAVFEMLPDSLALVQVF